MTIESNADGVITKRMFRIENDGRDELTQVVDQANRAQQDVIERFEYLYKAKVETNG